MIYNLNAEVLIPHGTGMFPSKNTFFKGVKDRSVAWTLNSSLIRIDDKRREFNGGKIFCVFLWCAVPPEQGQDEFLYT